MSAAFGQQIKQADITREFLSSPGDDLVVKTVRQLASIPAFVKLFGPYTDDKDQQRWAPYQRMDWSLRQLPAMNIFESNTESKDSDQAFLTGTVSFQIFWPANFRRNDLARVPAAFKGVMENFFNSQWVRDMLDELYWITRPMKVYGLNEYGKTMTWVPQTEGIVETELVPVTQVDANYRIDLRAWNRALEFMGRTKDDPFSQSLYDLTVIGGLTTEGIYQGVTDDAAQDVHVEIKQEIEVQNP